MTFVIFATILLTAFPQSTGPFQPPAQRCSGLVLTGLVVEHVEEGSAPEKAGLLPGDVLLSWERPSKSGRAQGSFDSIADWLWFETEEAPRGPILLSLSRNEVKRELQVGAGQWSLVVRPNLAPEILAKSWVGDEADQLLSKTGDHDTAAWLRLRMAEKWKNTGELSQALEEVLGALRESSSPLVEASTWEAAASIHLLRDEASKAGEALQRARALQEELSWESLGLARICHLQCKLSWKQRDLNVAREACEKALEIRKCSTPGTLEVADILNLLGNIALKADELAIARSLFEDALQIYDKLTPGSLAAAGTLNNLSATVLDKSTSLSYLLRALKIWEKEQPKNPTTASILNNLGLLYSSTGDWSSAETYLLRALRLREELEPEGLDVATSLNNLGALARKRGDLDASERFFRQALEIRERIAPGSLDVAITLTNLGMVARSRDDLGSAEDLLRRALALQNKLAPDSLVVASTLSSLGLVASTRGDLLQAEDCHRRALAIRERDNPGSLAVASSFNNLGLVSMGRGDLDLAEDQFKQALRLKEQLGDDPLTIAISLVNLGVVAWTRHDLWTAERQTTRALALQEKNAPGTLDMAATLDILGGIALERRDLAAARQYFGGSYKIRRTIAPDGLMISQSYHNLADVEWLEGDVRSARRLWEKALEIKERLAPGSMGVASSLENIAASYVTSDPDRAIQQQLRALVIRSACAPGSVSEAVNQADLAGMLQAKNRIAEAESHLVQAIDSLEHQIGNLGGSHHAKEEFGVRYDHIYHRLIDLLAEQGRVSEAFQVLERSRTRSLLAMLAERDLDFALDVPEVLGQRRSRLTGEYDHVGRELSELSPEKDSANVRKLLDRLRAIRDEHEEVLREIRKTSPRWATLQTPATLSTEQARDLLDPGTLLLSYSIGKKKSWLFLLARGRDVQVKEIAVGEEELRLTIDTFRGLIASAPSDSSTRHAALESLGRQLVDWLISPAAAEAEPAERLLFIPDGPLHILPWGALIHPLGEKPEYLAEWKSLHIVLSMTVYEKLKTDRSTRLGLVAFGAPFFPAPLGGSHGPSGDEPRVRAAIERGFDFTPLPASRFEVEKIAHIYAGHARTFFGLDASEENARAVSSDTAILHFATHATLDERSPLDSAVVLSIPATLEEGRDNGLLQAWEIFEQVRLDADLVVLSACETALGKELGGEGLIGLTRAFQYAGARTVLASLWKISDRTTAELMVLFYRHLKEGKSKDEALRAAQIELIRGPIEITNEKGEVEKVDASAPYYWAAFQLYGDWQ